MSLKPTMFKEMLKSLTVPTVLSVAQYIKYCIVAGAVALNPCCGAPMESNSAVSMTLQSQKKVFFN